jgi:hypothetical protein
MMECVNRPGLPFLATNYCYNKPGGFCSFLTGATDADTTYEIYQILQKDCHTESSSPAMLGL